jgi:NADH-quinone oxidoreductase subunit J
VAQEAHFLAAVQVIVYAGAIVVLFLFVLMLLGVDRAEDLSIEPLGGGQRIAAVLIGLAILALPLFAFWSTEGDATGAGPQQGDPNHLDGSVTDVAQIGESLFTTYLFAFEVTSVLLVIAVVGAVVLARKVKRADLIEDPLVEAHQAERSA